MRVMDPFHSSGGCCIHKMALDVSALPAQHEITSEFIFLCSIRCVLLFNLVLAFYVLF